MAAACGQVVRTGTARRRMARSGKAIALGAGMEITEGTRLEKALIIAACFPFLMMGLIFLFA
jgi:hypothetical protein